MSETDKHRDPAKIHKVADLMQEAHSILYTELHHEIYSDVNGTQISALATKVRKLAKAHEYPKYTIYKVDLKTLSESVAYKGLSKQTAKSKVSKLNQEIDFANPKSVYVYEKQ